MADKPEKPPVAVANFADSPLSERRVTELEKLAAELDKRVARLEVSGSTQNMWLALLTVLLLCTFFYLSCVTGVLAEFLDWIDANIW